MTKVEEAIDLANSMLDEWTKEDLQIYAYDRLVDELMAESPESFNNLRKQFPKGE